MIFPTLKGLVDTPLTAGSKGEQMKKDWKFHHIGLVVKDIGQVEQLVNLTGIGYIEKFSIVENGKKKDVKWFLHIGALTIDLHGEVPDDRVLINDSIKRDGQGLHHIAFHVDDIDKEIKDLNDAGAKLLYRQEITDGVTIKSGVLAFLGIQEMGVTLELTQVNEAR